MPCAVVVLGGRHDVPDDRIALRPADEVAIIDKGHIAVQGSPEVVLRMPRPARVTTMVPNRVHLLLQRLTRSSDRFLSEFAAKAVKEVAYHRELAEEWAERLGDGTEESARRMAEGLDWCWRFIPELFEVDESLASLIERGVAPDPREFEGAYRASIAAGLDRGRLAPPADQRPILGGRRGHHSEHLGHLLAVMQYLPRTYPQARW